MQDSVWRNKSRKLSPDHNLAIEYPAVAELWHPTKNGDVTPYDVTFGSNYIFWWFNPACGHEWNVSVNRMTGLYKHHYSIGSTKTGCPYCGGKRIDINNSLRAKYPFIAEEWHPTKNGSLTPDDVIPGSHKQIWWIGAKCKHEYEARIENRTRNGNGCPFCSGQATCKENCLATLYPQIAKEWHPTLNGTTTPFDVRSQSNKKFWWLCEYGHIWKTAVAKRTFGRNCPKCNAQSSKPQLIIFSELKFIFPDAENGAKIRGTEFDIYIPCISLAIEYDGYFWHKNKHNKDIAKNNFAHNLKIKLIRLRDMRLDKINSNDIVVDSKKEISFNDIKQILIQIQSHISTEHELNNSIKNYLSIGGLQNTRFFKQINEQYKKILTKNNITQTHPEIAVEWDFLENGNLKTEMFTYGSGEKIGWICKNDSLHKWKATIANRCRLNRGCPYCSGRTAGETNNFAILRPDILKNWDYIKNGDLAPESLRPGCGKRIHWLCEKGHSEIKTITNRIASNGCVQCKRDNKLMLQRTKQKTISERSN